MSKIMSPLEKNIAAQVASLSSSDSSVKMVKKTFAALPDKHFKLMAEMRGLNQENADIYASFMKGDSSAFIDKIKNIEDWFQPGDLVLMTGVSKKSHALVDIQKKVYRDARSSHVAIVYTDHICIDAMPKLGVQLRTISQLLRDCEADWRILRFNNIDESSMESLVRKSTYFLMQPYKIQMNRKTNKKYTYCSELARKIYFESEIKGTQIPNNRIIKPCDFDRLADQNNNWIDITDKLRPAYEIVNKFDGFLSIQFEHFYRGIRLNRERFNDRLKWRKDIRLAVKNGAISKEKGDELLKEIDTLDMTMENQFWDAGFSKNLA